MRWVSGVLRHVPHVAVFDTAFHSTLPAEAATYAVEGVPMTTRSGAIDPGALLYPLREQGLFAEENDRQLENESGLAGSASAASSSTLTRTRPRPPDANVESFRSTVCVVVRAREDLVFARAMRRLVA
jgi:acetate kinase